MLKVKKLDLVGTNNVFEIINNFIWEKV